MKRLVSILAVLFVSTGIWAQGDSVLYQREQVLNKQLKALRAAKNDQDRTLLNKQFKKNLHETIQLEGAFDHPFSSLSTLGTIKSPDGAFRLFNWNVEQDDQSNKYYCFVLRYDKRKKKWLTVELIDNSAVQQPRPKEILYEDNWYGALYYKIIPVKKSGKVVYTVLGLDAGNRASHVKLIDIMSFSGNRVKLGSSMFKMNDGTHKRLFFEHSKKAYMSLRYDAGRKRIIYDHLSPEAPSLVGFYEYYVPDMTYDQLDFVNNKWQLKEDVIGVNEKDARSVSIRYMDPKHKSSGDVKTRTVKNTWVDPTDKSAPGGANVHVARLPGDEMVSDKQKQFDKEEKRRGRKRTKHAGNRKHRSEFSMNPFLKKGSLK
ncbi:MAG: hypothetical protein EP338_13990 [Bacteroidetes bacterium]|nr:MAG: hypothetical protein EP338_13990 [Bacteroidota bacterium]